MSYILTWFVIHMLLITSKMNLTHRNLKRKFLSKAKKKGTELRQKTLIFCSFRPTFSSYTPSPNKSHIRITTRITGSVNPRHIASMTELSRCVPDSPYNPMLVFPEKQSIQQLYDVGTIITRFTDGET